MVVVAGLCGMATVFGLVVGKSQAQTSQPQNQSGVKPLRVAVVNPYEVYRDSEIYREFIREFNDFLEHDSKEKINELREELRKKEQFLEEGGNTLPPPTIQATQRDIETLKTKIEAMVKMEETYATQLQVKYEAEILAATLCVIESIAKRGNYDIVLKRIDLKIQNEAQFSETQGLAENAFSRMLDQSMVLYYNGKDEEKQSYTIEDITEQAKEEMGNKKVEDLRSCINRKLGK